MLDVLTTDDLIRVGACADGVAAFLAELKAPAAAMPLAELLPLADDYEASEWLIKASEADGFGDGDGFGNGDRKG